MLEGTVARLLNQLLGKYVTDLDTENLNVGIFSGQVQLTDLKLKTEALYELDLPIEVKAGTIGKICLQIPWMSLWSEPITITIEDVHVVVGPIVSSEPFDPEKNKRLTRSAKKKLLADLDKDNQLLGGPAEFAENLVSNILNCLQVNVSNIHLRYEDETSWKTPVAVGLCIGSITAESTNNKWKPAKHDPKSTTNHYLIKMDSVCAYWNPEVEIQKWDFPSDYYQWRNAMSEGLRSYSMNYTVFDFLINPMTTKIKMAINKSENGQVTKLHTEVIIRDCNVQISKTQFDSIMAVVDSMRRMRTSWQHLSKRPKETILDDRKAWWKYAYLATIEQRLSPYTWSRIKKVRQQYKEYLETYKEIILNPNDTELKLDLQKYEDNLSIVNVVIARQQARLLLKSRSIGEKSFWSMLPSTERLVLCEKIGYFEKQNSNTSIEHTYGFKLGNLNIALSNNSREVLTATLTQSIVNFKPNFKDDTFRISFKVEGIIVEGTTSNDHLSPILSSEHLEDSPAYILKGNLEKMPKDSKSPYKLNVSLDCIECVYNKQSLEDLEQFLSNETKENRNLVKHLQDVPNMIYKFLKDKLSKKWDLNLNVKLPHFVIPDNASYTKAKHLLVVDLGRYSIKTEICQNTQIFENATQMELGEQLYSKLHFECTDAQVLFCDSKEDWRAARKEKDTEMHLIPKTGFTATYALSVMDLQTIPKYKFNTTFQSLKMNISERKLGLLLKYFNIDHVRINVITEAMQPILQLYQKDRINDNITSKYLRKVQDSIRISDTLRYRKYRNENGRAKMLIKEQSVHITDSNNMNEAWARTVDLPGLEDNISPTNNINILLGFLVNEFTIVFSRSSDSCDRQYLTLRLGLFTMDLALMTYGPAYQISLNSIMLSDKLHTTHSGQYLDLLYSPLPSNMDVVTILYRKVTSNCPDFWTHFHGVETSLVANFGAINVLLHQEAIHTIVKYLKYFSNKMQQQISPFLKKQIFSTFQKVKDILHKGNEVPVPPGSVKFSQSARMSDLNVTVCDSDFDIVNIQLSGLEVDFLFRANERFVFRSYLSSIVVEHLSDVTLYSKVLYTDEDKVYEIKYVRNAPHVNTQKEISPDFDEITTDGSFKFQLGKINCIFLYKLVVQLQRFAANLDALPFLEKSINFLRQTILTATNTLKNKTKISLAINICGPVFLIPQKSSSPNVLVINTGNLHIENFFKESGNEVVENILVKLKDVNITRGIMTLTSSLEMQETLVEPTCLNMDIKKITNTKTSQKSWEIDSILESIQVTLGQKDILIITAIHKDNIGEGKIFHLLPNQIKSPIEVDENVRTLEAFFCEPKQKNVSAKCKIDRIEIAMFFDSIELLSSPIRDLNHGLCKLVILETDMSLVMYTDRSLDGKLSVNTVEIEEIGPDANAYEKIILASPADESRNNNVCNITVNKPPIVDVTFHQNKTGDKSADVIVGRLSFSLSIPFCEKLALFIIECMPKDSMDVGIVNQGYESEMYQTDQAIPNNSLTVSVRVNRPEFIFLVETTSNKKRYFITKSEILLDYSRHCNRINLVMSLSGLHSLFYDLKEYSDIPFVILKQCDVEVSRCVDEDSEKIVLAVSAMYVKLCREVAHSINDILNDIVEHFKVPETELNAKEKRKNQKVRENEDMWEPKKMDNYVELNETSIQTRRDHKMSMHESFSIPKFDMVLIFELEQTQVLLLKSTVEVNLTGWNYLLNCTCEISVQANYFNENFQNWEPFIDPVSIEEKQYRPFEFLVKIFQDKPLPMIDSDEQKKSERSNRFRKMKTGSRSYTTTEDEDSGEDMMYLEPVHLTHMGNNRRVKTSLSTFLDDSDSENEDCAMEKLAAAISDLFTGDWNEHKDSDCEQSSEGDDEVSEIDKPKEEPEELLEKALYVMVDAKDTLNFTVTPTLLRVLNELFTQYSTKIISVKVNRKSINVTNDIGPDSRVELYEKQNEDTEENKLVCLKKFENEESPPNSPSKTVELFNETESVKDVDFNGSKEHVEIYDFETLASLNFPQQTTAELYEKINKHFLKIHIPNFLPVQTNCSRRNWEKLIRLHSTTVSPTYYLAAKHVTGKFGRNILVGSPLKIKNETCFALNVLYQPFVLQELNLEPMGDVTNPFETTMRITILEPHEEYNIPMFIAYHCKLFVQPAYSDCYCASESGIWWKTMATELDTAHNIHCRSKNEKNPETFSLKVILKKNLDVKKSYAHSIPNYVIHLLPPVVLHNFLPYTLEAENPILKQTVKVEPGENIALYTVDVSKDQKLTIRIKYGQLTWCGVLNLTSHLDEKILTTNPENKDETHSLAINVKCEKEDSCHLLFYVPYWIVNKTGLPVQIKASSTNNVCDTPNDEMLLFTYKRHGKQTLSVRVYGSGWSNEFGLDCAGTTGLVICKDAERKKKYMFFLNTRLSNLCPRLTKIVTLLPSFLVINETGKALRFMEHNEKTDLWIDIAQDQKMIFWPETSSMQMYLKYRDSKLVSQAFFIACQHTTVLRMDRGSAITVKVTGGVKDSFRITFRSTIEGDAPVLVKNYCADVFLKVQQQDQSQVTLLNPQSSLLYTWDDPTRPRQLVWNVYNNKGSGFFVDIHKDGYGEERIKFHSVTPNNSHDSSSSDDSDSSYDLQNTLKEKIRKDKIVIYWACHRQGAQRVLLFTQDQRIFNNVLKTRFREPCSLDLFVSLANVGISIFVSEEDTKESLHAVLDDAPAVWEVNVGQKWKTLTLELAAWIEDKYRARQKKCQIKDYVHIDFEKMFMLKPFFAEIRRTYRPAVRLHYRRSRSFMYLNTKVQHFQMDNKKSGAIVLQPCICDEPKEQQPFFQVALSKLTSKECDIFRYVTCSFSNFYLNIENDLILSLGKLLKEGNRFWEIGSPSSGYVSDISAIHKSITSKINGNSHGDSMQTLIEYLTISSFGIQLNIANKIQLSLTEEKLPLAVTLDYLFPYNISPYMPNQGVHHKISSIEHVDIQGDLTKTARNLTDQVVSQFLQQYYSHVLGIQVLVNTFAIHPSIEVGKFECEKLGQILSYGCMCVLGHIDMSPAALETCILDIFPNQSGETLPKIKRHGSYHDSDTCLPKAVAVSAKNFTIAVPLALRQLIVKNHNGTNCDTEMFFRTTGKALFSLMTRHYDERSNCVEIAREALRRASMLGEPVRILQRLTRYRNPVLGMQPFSMYDSMGHHLLEMVGNSRFQNDTYWAHAAVEKGGKSIVIVSLEHVLRVNKCSLWGPWDIEWVVDLDDIVSMPKINCVELILNMRQNEKKNDEHQIKIGGQREILVWLHEKIEQAIVVSMEEKSWAVVEN